MVKAWWNNYRKVKGGEPLVEKEPAVDQVAGMYARVVTLKLEPYADFSVLTPYGRRIAKVLRHRKV